MTPISSGLRGQRRHPGDVDVTHQQRPDQRGIRAGSMARVVADRDVERRIAGREDRGVVDQAIEQG